MKRATKTAIRRSLCATACALAMATAAIGAEVGVARTAAPSAPTEVSAPGTTSLEQSFWACDYVATTRGTSAAPAEFCAAIYDEIKATKFDGDFDKLLVWWQANKDVAHEELAAALAVHPPRTLLRRRPTTSRTRSARVDKLMTAARTWLHQLAPPPRNP